MIVGVTVSTATTYSTAPQAYRPRINTTAGVCELEVPIVSILPPELKHTAHTIRGNGSAPGFSKIKICCSGYKIVAHTPFHCTPDCPSGCGLGNCTAPNVCTCNKGAGFGPDGKCVSVCPGRCLNGQCYGNFCNCNSGFVLEPNGRYCTGGCTRNCGPGGQCVGNNQCSCLSGFALNSQGTCQMICAPGFQQMGSACEPLCPKGCVNGECVAPGQCRCKSGYALNSSKVCAPKCSQPCYNGFCSAPNVCTCKEGYIKDATSRNGNRCIAYCAAGCPNGTCSAPNFCICKQGYVKQSKGSNVCVKK